TTPLSGSDKTWYIVFDNTAHDGDEGLGDQGGSTSKFLIDVTIPEESTYPLIHNTYSIDAGQRINIANFAVDSNSELNYWIHPISGDGEFFIQSNNQLSGDLIIAGTRFDQLVDDINYETWLVPEYLDLQNINLMVEAGNSGFHFTIQGSFDPVLLPVVMDYVNGSTTIGEPIILDASESPNSLDQISSISWDFNSDQTTDEQGFIVEAVWSSPGLKTINATAESSTGEIMVVSHQIMVNDDSNPTAEISGVGTRGIDAEWRLLRLSDLTLRSANSYDDHQIATTSWYVNGVLLGTDPDFTVSWSEIGTYKVKLTVTDPSGNSNSTEDVIVVYDSTIPALEMSEIEAASTVYRGEMIQFTANAVDLWDDESNLTFTWDFDLEKDSNGDGDTRNDPDMVGKSVEVSFEETG
ncbi:MAG: PKD domain-containing protein, partial [Euryarchaeota archaeon]